MKAATSSIKTYDRTTRRNGKWAKLTKHSDGTYSVAEGWAGDFKAVRVRTFSNNYGLAITYRDSWLDL